MSLPSRRRKPTQCCFNTCSVRAHAEDKILQRAGPAEETRSARNPEKLIGVIGCMAQNHQKQIFERAPFVDLIVGPGQLHQIPQLLRDVGSGWRAAKSK